MRALLIVNPRATTTTPRVRDVLARALESEVKLDLAETDHRGHAIDLARQAARDGMDVVVCLGGDGTVNEVVNGLLADGPGTDVPALAIVPAGSTNVAARNLGLSRDPVEATGEIVSALRAGSARLIGLGRLDQRWFTFNAGMGFDAEVIRRVEQRRRRGAPATGGLVVRSAFRQFLTDTERRHAPLVLTRPGSEPVAGVFAALVSNSAPWSYLGDRPVNASPAASFDAGLDVLALRRMRLAGTLHTAAGMLRAGGAGPGTRRARAGEGDDGVRQPFRFLQLHDQAEVRLAADRPMAVQVDGDYLGERQSVLLVAVPDALRVVLPADA